MSNYNTGAKIVEIAHDEMGATNGRKYVQAYNDRSGIGLPLDCAWCACFVSWVMREAGVPQESVEDYKGCVTGVDWFTAQGRYRTRGSGYVPQPGDVIFFEWQPWNEGSEYDDGVEHTGIVSGVKNGCVHTIEGNSGSYSTCDSWAYDLDDDRIDGYGVPICNAGGGEPEIYPEADVHPEVWVQKNEAGQIVKVALRVDHGSVRYQAHLIGGEWLPWVTGFDPDEHDNGYAGNGEPIDAVTFYYETPANEPYQQARYAVKTEKSSGWLPEQEDDSTEDGMDGYAGNFGEAITSLKLRIANR